MQPIVITSGEPAGIGPDIVLKLTQHNIAMPVAIMADRHLLRQRARQLHIDYTLPDYDVAAKKHPPFSLQHIALKQPCHAGQANHANATYVIAMLQAATQACLRGEYAALVTAPVNKAIINEAGIDFCGHTELLAQLTGVKQTVMLMVNDMCRVALLTTHVPLTQVPQLVTPQRLTGSIEIIQQDLMTRFAINQPRILVCGLNPHAGEAGYLGDEEITVINPTLTALKRRGFNVSGPIPADTAFIPSRLAQTDVVLTLYHDQGLPVVKALAFADSVNVTLGLPLIRTSVDHGTAFELAGSGRADEHSLLAAVKLAYRLVTNNHRL